MKQYCWTLFGMWALAAPALAQEVCPRGDPFVSLVGLNVSPLERGLGRADLSITDRVTRNKVLTWIGDETASALTVEVNAQGVVLRVDADANWSDRGLSVFDLFDISSTVDTTDRLRGLDLQPMIDYAGAPTFERQTSQGNQILAWVNGTNGATAVLEVDASDAIVRIDVTPGWLEGNSHPYDIFGFVPT